MSAACPRWGFYRVKVSLKLLQLTEKFVYDLGRRRYRWPLFLYTIFITKLVSEENGDRDTINTIIKLGVMVYQLNFLILDGPGCNDCNCGLVCSEYSLKNIF